ncbi:MAG: stage 0 sporulation family protein [Dehalococcoidia bacterium]
MDTYQDPNGLARSADAADGADDTIEDSTDIEDAVDGLAADSIEDAALPLDEEPSPPPPARPPTPVAGVRFIESGPITYCSPGDLDLGVGDYVIVRTDRGERLGWVVLAPDQLLAGRPEGPLRVISRLATEDDVHAWERNKDRAQEDLRGAQALASRNDPRVRVASLTYDLAGTHGELTFTAPERVEHRWLDGQLSDLLGARISVTQVGDRDRAKAAQGYDICGLALCCSTWMTEFPSISIKMAKDQDLPPNPSKISGVCGRLLCCLSYEVEAYRELRGDLPKVGKRVTTPVGRARVLSMNSLKQLVRLRLDDTGEVIEIAADELRKQYGNAVRPEELEAQVEEPLRRRDRQLRDAFVAPIAPVDAPAPGTLDLIGEAEAIAAAAEDGAGSPASGDPTRKRRRRGRRGGRNRRPGGAEGTTSEDTSSDMPDGPAGDED